ncbi:MAG: hypothetical protein V1750_07320 [Acidobacteriota bacterium]
MPLKADARVKEGALMARCRQLSRWLIIAAGVVLAGTAAFHATGYNSVSTAIQASGAKPFLVAAVKALWLMFSAHLILLSIVVILASGMPRARLVLLACAVIPAVDSVLLFHFAGLFVGTVSLAVAAILLVLGGLIQASPEDMDGRA